MAGAQAGQQRLDRIVSLIAESMATEVCSIYLFRNADTLELCATEGLAAEAIPLARLRPVIVVDAGDPQKIHEVTDIWTFARDISSPDPNWRLVATQASQ